MWSSLPRIITMNFSHPSAHLHYLRELISKFQTLDRDPSGEIYNGQRYSFVWSCPKNAWVLKERSEFWRHFPKPHPSSNVPHFNTLLYQIGSRIPTRINSTSISTRDYCFKARIWPILSIGHCDRSRIFWVYSHRERMTWDLNNHV